MIKYHVFVYHKPTKRYHYGCMVSPNIKKNNNIVFYSIFFTCSGALKAYDTHGKWASKYIFRVVRRNHV